MTNKEVYLEVKDHSVSGEQFQLVYNSDNYLLETHPQPSVSDLPKYYESDEYISHTDSKRNMFEHIYHFIRKIALSRKLSLINSFSKSTKSVLDIGCGTGDFLEKAKNNNWNVTGIEPNEQARKLANSKTENTIYDISKLLEFEENSFDVITLWHVFEHLPNLDEHIEIIKKLLKDTGRLIIAVPNYKSYDAKHYGEFWAAYDVPRHLWHFSKKSIKVIFGKKSFEIEKVLPMKFDAFYVSILSEKYKNSNLQFFRGLYRGWRSNLKARRTKEYSSLIYVLKHHNSDLEKR